MDGEPVIIGMKRKSEAQEVQYEPIDIPEELKKAAEDVDQSTLEGLNWYQEPGSWSGLTKDEVERIKAYSALQNCGLEHDEKLNRKSYTAAKWGVILTGVGILVAIIIAVLL